MAPPMTTIVSSVTTVGDRLRRFARVFKEPFRGSLLWPNTSSLAWFFDELSDVANGPDSWPELSKPKPLGPNRTANVVLWHIRNALAHGNIFIRGEPEIEQIILLSQRAVGTNKFYFLAVAPADFRRFLKNWLKFLRALELPEDVVSEDAKGVAYGS